MIFKKIIKEIKILNILFIVLFFINSFFYLKTIGIIDYSIYFLWLNLIILALFLRKYILQTIYFEKEKIKIQKLLKTWKNNNLQNTLFNKESDLYKIFKRTYVSKNILENDIDRISNNFNKLIPHQFIESIWKWINEDINIWLSVKKYLHIMFIDISGFTEISEKIKPKKALTLLNIYFDGIVEITKKNWWYVDKFLWDWIMVIFDCKYSDNILKTAVEIINLINNINVWEFKNKINMWIWINSWEVILWTIWSKKRMDISIIWDTVNIASRLEYLTRENEDWIIFSKETYDLINNKEKFNINEIWKKKIKWKKEGMFLYWINI